MEIRTLPVGQLDTNCYIVWEADGQAVVIDPGAQAGRILDEADAAGVRVRAVLLTHVHFDHILAAREVMNATGAKLLVPAGDEPALTSPARSLLAMFLPGCRYDLQADRLLVDGDTVTVGGLTLTEELRRAAEFAYMSREELLACQEAAVDAAFCGPETKNFLRRALAEFQQS